jgi:formiminotetrahydrofolate cyclodeaminase
MPDFLQGSVQQYLDQLASGDPTPGGGSAAGLTGALGAALLCMSACFTVGREKYAAYDENAQRVLEEAETLRAKLQELMEEDAVAYGAYRAASALPKDTDEQKEARKAAIQESTKASAQVPLRIARHCYRLLELAGVLAGNCNPYLVSDVVVATHNALAAFRSAVINIRMNLGSLADQEFVGAMESELQPMIDRSAALAREALKTAYEAMSLPLEQDVPKD